MKYVDEFRDGALGRKVAAQILGVVDFKISVRHRRYVDLTGRASGNQHHCRRSCPWHAGGGSADPTVGILGVGDRDRQRPGFGQR